MWHLRLRPMRRGVQNFLFRPASGKEERHATERHHADGISQKRHWHELTQAAHFANVLFVMTTVNHRACAEKQKRLEKTVREQMHDPGRYTADAKRHHHQAELRTVE